jgi:hypothetical protein
MKMTRDFLFVFNRAVAIHSVMTMMARHGFGVAHVCKRYRTRR